MNEIATIQPAAPQRQVSLFDPEGFDHMARVSAAIAKAGDLCPKPFQNKPEAVFLALTIAQDLDLPPMMVLQNLYVVHGTAGWAAKFYIALANRGPTFRGSIKFDVSGTGEDMAVTAWATLAETGERIEYTVDMKTAKAEGWTKNSKYKTLPQLMLSYRAGAFLVRLYAPESVMGIPTIDEAQETALTAQPRPATGANDALRQTLGVEVVDAVPAVTPYESVLLALAEANDEEALDLAVTQARELTDGDTLTDEQREALEQTISRAIADLKHDDMFKG